MPIITTTNKIVSLCVGAILSASIFASEGHHESPPVNAFRVSFADTLTPHGAKSISLRAADLINRKGRVAVAEFSRLDGGFLIKDGFVFCMTLDGIMISHPVRPQLIGQNLSAYDRYGETFFQEMIQVALSLGEGWVEYKWPYPGTNELRQKVSYVVRNKEGFFCGVAAFK
ncbi:cache domain-containing protein [Leucothrix pacifica]|uniref:Histidine kinase n=1 Tax=Leucothrix pacifica TaxID=1247513 RepID=A0A317CPP2_9GAMM|nr:cache domain-containing protein [Leucothrix pacifica]PWQ99453.1 histidine kinase [Leucothrix pacifica]